MKSVTSILRCSRRLFFFFYLVDVFQQARGDVGEVSVHGSVLAVLQQAAELHHLGVGRAEAEAPVHLWHRGRAALESCGNTLWHIYIITRKRKTSAVDSAM